MAGHSRAQQGTSKLSSYVARGKLYMYQFDTTQTNKRNPKSPDINFGPCVSKTRLQQDIQHSTENLTCSLRPPSHIAKTRNSAFSALSTS